MARALSHSQQLRRKIRLLSPWLDRSSRAFWAHPGVRELYPELLFNVHCIIRASVPLLETALGAAHARSDVDRVAALLAGYLSRHIPEERHHDDWLLEDLEVLGVERSQVLKRIPSPTAAALVGAQYYWVLHAHPVGVLGYVAVLEGNPPSPSFLEGVVARTGLPRAAFRTYFKHGSLDPQHGEDLNAALDSMPLTASQSALVGVSAFHTVGLLRALFDGLVESRAAMSAPVS